MSQSSVALTADGSNWAILNASPDIRAQLAATSELHPTGPRDVPLRSVLITNADLDHVTGLLTLRESQSFGLFATQTVHKTMAANPMLDFLRKRHVQCHDVALDESFELVTGVRATLFSVPGKVPLYQEGDEVAVGTLGEYTIGVELEVAGRRALYIPGCADIPDWLVERARGADLLMFDGTLWEDDEMIRMGLGQKTGRRMGHVPASETVVAFADAQIKQRVFVHINNSNPLTDPRSQETAQVQKQGWQVGYDGMEITL